ncbi:hypothetical protein BJ742DRAFT_768461 [Cladochytrium replicatum]|nr:hypothetical protein BJ742DRAFT_768461 [Cladochytrium replicatum]
MSDDFTSILNSRQPVPLGLGEYTQLLQQHLANVGQQNEPTKEEREDDSTDLDPLFLARIFPAHDFVPYIEEHVQSMREKIKKVSTGFLKLEKLFPTQVTGGAFLPDQTQVVLRAILAAYLTLPSHLGIMPPTLDDYYKSTSPAVVFYSRSPRIALTTLLIMSKPGFRIAAAACGDFGVTPRGSHDIESEYADSHAQTSPPATPGTPFSSQSTAVNDTESRSSTLSPQALNTNSLDNPDTSIVSARMPTDITIGCTHPAELVAVLAWFRIRRHAAPSIIPVVTNAYVIPGSLHSLSPETAPVHDHVWSLLAHQSLTHGDVIYDSDPLPLDKPHVLRILRNPTDSARPDVVFSVFSIPPLDAPSHIKALVPIGACWIAVFRADEGGMEFLPKCIRLQDGTRAVQIHDEAFGANWKRFWPPELFEHDHDGPDIDNDLMAEGVGFEAWASTLERRHPFTLKLKVYKRIRSRNEYTSMFFD